VLSLTPTIKASHNLHTLMETKVQTSNVGISRQWDFKTNYQYVERLARWFYHNGWNYLLTLPSKVSRSDHTCTMMKKLCKRIHGQFELAYSSLSAVRHKHLLRLFERA
jgi:hypothetical protein